MCLILFAYEAHPQYRLIVAANRDEFYTRPTQAAAFWPDAPAVLAGRDLQHGGTWLGTTRAGRFAAVTNYRDPATKINGAPSRGALVSDFLNSRQPPDTYMRELAARAGGYNGFNLLTGDAESLYYFSNRGGAPERLGPGVYGLSNHLLDTPWPKVARGKQTMAEAVRKGDALRPESLIEMLFDRVRAADAELPDTGVGIEIERVLSPLFIVSNGYGTRCSTVVLFDRAGKTTFVERTYDGADASRWREARYEFNVCDTEEGTVGQRSGSA